MASSLLNMLSQLNGEGAGADSMDVDGPGLDGFLGRGALEARPLFALLHQKEFFNNFEDDFDDSDIGPGRGPPDLSTTASDRSRSSRAAASANGSVDKPAAAAAAATASST